jgi:hypothetical protein
MQGCYSRVSPSKENEKMVCQIERCNVDAGSTSHPASRELVRLTGRNGCSYADLTVHPETICRSLFRWPTTRTLIDGGRDDGVRLPRSPVWEVTTALPCKLRRSRNDLARRAQSVKLTSERVCELMLAAAWSGFPICPLDGCKDNSRLRESVCSGMPQFELPSTFRVRNRDRVSKSL